MPERLLGPIFLPFDGVAQVVVCIMKARVERQRFPVSRDRFGFAPEILQQNGQVE